VSTAFDNSGVISEFVIALSLPLSRDGLRAMMLCNHIPPQDNRDEFERIARLGHWSNGLKKWYIATIVKDFSLLMDDPRILASILEFGQPVQRGRSLLK
jgi:hypothetical protein